MEQVRLRGVSKAPWETKFQLTGVSEEGEDTERADTGKSGQTKDLSTVVWSVEWFSGTLRAERGEVGCWMKVR